MENRVNTLIVGATYFGIGYASSHPDCMILEPTQIVGGEFHNCTRAIDTSEVSEREVDSSLGKLMNEHSLWENGQLDVLKASPVLFDYLLKNKNIRISLEVKIISIEKTDSGYCVEYASNSGIRHIYCSQIMDTTPLRETYPEGARCVEKSLSLFTVCLDNDNFDKKLKEACPSCTVSDFTRPGEKIVTFPVPVEDSIFTAYENLFSAWQAAFPEGEEKILFIAQDFDYISEKANEEAAPGIWVYEHYSNPLTAFVKGMDYQL